MLEALSQPLPRILRTDEIIPIMTRHIDAHRKVIDSITDTIDVSNACFDNVIKPQLEFENAHAGEQAVMAALKYISPSLDCQHTAEKADEMWQKYSSSKRHELYILVKAVKDKGERLDGESRKRLDRILLEFEDIGYGILDEDGIHQRLQRLNKIEQLCANFNRNLREYDGGEWFTPEEIDGVPSKDREQPAGPDGKEFFSYESRYFTIMRHAHNPETRKRMLLAHNQRFADNVPLFREIILLRDESARELGQASHAATKLPYRSAESVEWVEELMKSLMETLLPHGRAEFERVIQRKQRHFRDMGRDNDGLELMPWDFLYYSNLLDKELAQVGLAAIAEYFPLRHTFTAMLCLFADCLQLQCDPISKEVLKETIWAEDIEAWAVWDKRKEKKGEFIGYLFADLLSRPNKYKGNQSVNLQPSYLKVDGTRMYPANIIMCNFHDFRPTKPCLLNHNSVITLFHELGHSIHDLVARTKYAASHGYNVTLELGEGIGKMMEQWCWLPNELKAISRHYTQVNPVYLEAWRKENPGREIPPERIPDELLQHRLSRRRHTKIHMILGMMVDVFLDLAVHNPSSRKSLLELDEGELLKDIYEKLKFRRLPDPCYAHVSNGLLFSGYDAGYYCYISAEIFGADLFRTNFAENPRSQVAWDKFRRAILERGGSGDDLAMVQGFLGRPIDPGALLSILGL